MVKARFIGVPLLLTTALLLAAQAQKPGERPASKVAAEGAARDASQPVGDQMFCPRYLMGQYNGIYFYYCQNCDGTCNDYSQLATSTAETCGGCCSDSNGDSCCGGTPCADQITVTGADNQANPNRGRMLVGDDRNEVFRIGNADMQVDVIDQDRVLENLNGTYRKGDAHFCAPTPGLQVTEFFVKVPSSATTFFYFRCFDVVDADNPVQAIRIGHQMSSNAWNNNLTQTQRDGATNTAFDTFWGNKTQHNQRVSVTLGKSTKNCYLFSSDALQQ